MIYGSVLTGILTTQEGKLLLRRIEWGATLNRQQKLMACAALSRGWRKAIADEETWKHLDNRGKAQFIRSKIREEIYALPEKTTWWGKVKSWIGK